MQTPAIRSELFKNKGTFLLYIGRQDADAQMCQDETNKINIIMQDIPRAI